MVYNVGRTQLTPTLGLGMAVWLTGDWIDAPMGVGVVFIWSWKDNRGNPGPCQQLFRGEATSRRLKKGTRTSPLQFVGRDCSVNITPPRTILSLYLLRRIDSLTEKL